MSYRDELAAARARADAAERELAAARDAKETSEERLADLERRHGAALAELANLRSRLPKEERSPGRTKLVALGIVFVVIAVIVGWAVTVPSTRTEEHGVPCSVMTDPSGAEVFAVYRKPSADAPPTSVDVEELLGGTPLVIPADAWRYVAEKRDFSRFEIRMAGYRTRTVQGLALCHQYFQLEPTQHWH